MKSLLLATSLLLSLNSFAVVNDCEQVTKLQCEVTYYSQTGEQQTSTVKMKSQAYYELQNWDEPSLAYCQSWIGFNQKGLYIEATLTEESQTLSMRMMKSSQGGVTNDQAGTEIKAVEGQTYTSTLSLSPKTAEGVYAAVLKCSMVK